MGCGTEKKNLLNFYGYNQKFYYKEDFREASLYVQRVGGWWGDGAVVLDDVFVTHVKLGRGVPVHQK